MHRPHLRRSSVATIAAATALVVATGGTSAYAAHLVTSKQIKNNTIKSIDVHNGTLTPADMAPGTLYGGSYAWSTYHDAGVSIQNQVASADPTVLSLSVPAGSYVIDATSWLENGGTLAVLVRCTLSAGGDTDLKRPTLEPAGSPNASSAAVDLQVVHTFSTAGTAKLTCWSFGEPTAANNTKITAVKVDHLSNVAG